MLAFLTVFPLCAILFPLTASAVEAASEGTPTVSLAWDTSTVTVTDGVATPYKNAGTTASSYTMKYKIVANGNVTAPITVRVQSFDLSAKVSAYGIQREYAGVDNTVTLTAQNPTATGTVTVYRHEGYATKVTETGVIYTNEFGLRITEITNAKKQSGADTLRSQVLARNGYTLPVSKNSQGSNYGGGTGTLPNSYVYTDMAREYVSSTVSYTVDHQQTSTGTFNPYSVLQAQNSSSLNSLLDFHYGMDIYFNGQCYVTSDQNVAGKRAGLTFKIIEYFDGASGLEVAKNDYGDARYCDGFTFNWDVSYNTVADGEVATASAYHRGTSYDSDYIRARYLIDKSVYKYSFYNKEDKIGNKSVKGVTMKYSVLLTNSQEVYVHSYNIEDRAYGAEDTVYLTIYFDRPMQIAHNDGHPLKIQARIGDSTANYFTYCGGNMTDRLIFSMVLPEDREIYGSSIELMGFVNEDYNNTVVDLFWNKANKNNAWSVEDSKIAGQRLACTVDTRTPDISVQNIVGNVGTVKSGSFNVTVADITNKGKIDVAWAKESTPPTAVDAWSSVAFSVNDVDRTTVSIEKKGLTGVYYAHVRATSVSGNQSFTTVGPFTFDNQSPVLSNIRLADGDSAQKYLKEHTLLFDISDVSIGVDKIYMKVRHADGNKGLAGGADELLVYTSGEAGTLLTLTGSAAEIMLTTEMLDLAVNSYGAYTVGFYAIDKLGNQSDITELSDSLMFDNRNTFNAVINSTVDISVNGKQIFYNGKSISFSHSEVGNNT